MRSAPATLLGHRALLGGLIVLLVLSGAAVLPGVSGSSPPPRAGTGESSAGGFAAAAGFAPSLDGKVARTSPLASALEAVVTFRPSSPSLFDPPSPGSPPLTPAQIGDRYGLSPSAYAAAEAYFEGQGLLVLHPSPDRLSLSLEGPAAAMDRAFATTLVTGDYGGRMVAFPAAPPALPPWLEPRVAGVTGLSSGFTHYSLPLRSLVVGRATASPAAMGDLITPAIARQVYGVSSLYNVSGAARFAGSQTIVLLLWGDGYAPNDITTFFSTDYPGQFPAPEVNAFPIDGAPAPSASAVNDPSAAPQELTLDLEWAGSLAPGARLDAVYAPDGPSSNQFSPTDSTMVDAMNKAVTGIPGVDVISMSFGTDEGAGGGLETAWATDFAEAMQERITLVAATGDTGGDQTANPCSGGPAPEYPAASPDVLAVGGTAVTLSRSILGQVTGIANETAWYGSGGGFSTQYAAPSWQEVGSAAGPIGQAGHRGMPDVSASASNNFVYYNGAQRTGAGTSFAAPLWGGIVAEMNALHGSPLGLLTPRIYSIGAAEPAGRIAIGLADVRAGSNCLGPATVGWDTATGWGTPRAVYLYADLTATFVNLTVSAGPAPVGPGGTLTVVARLTNSSSGLPISGVAVALTVTSDTDFGPCSGTFGSASVVTGTDGRAATNISIPGCYLGTHAIASAQVTAEGLFGAAQVNIGVNLLGLVPLLAPAGTYPSSVALFAVIMVAAMLLGGLLGRAPAVRSPRRPPSPPAVPPAVAPPSDPPPVPPETAVLPPEEAPVDPLADPEPPPTQMN